MGIRKFGLLAAALFSADGVRIKRTQKGSPIEGAKFIAGVPILNYNEKRVSKHSMLQSKALKEDWILVTKPGVTDEQIHALCKSSTCLREGHPSKAGVPYFEIRASEEQLSKLLETSGSFIKFVERDGEVQLIPDIEEADTSAASWGLDRVGVSTRFNEGAGVHVYVLDTGIRASHQDFGGRVVPALDMTTGSLLECNGDLSCAGDVQSHGSHCAGSAAGTTYGVASAAYIHSVKVLSDQGSGSWSWSYDALDWLATKGEFPAVASMSLGGSGTQSAMEAAVDTAVNAGVVVVVAGGNDNSNACGFSPAFVPSAITVGSTTSTDSRSYFSNYGECTKIWAPGSSIVSVGISSDTASSSKSGTSMACPHVSGAVALVLAANPAFKSPAALQYLLDRSETGALSDLKSGDVNKLLWVGAGAAPEPVPTPAPITTTQPPPPPPFTCNNGCDISPNYVNDGYCDCTGCEDEEEYTCETCGGCPSSCGSYIKCGQPTPAPTPVPVNFVCDDGCDISDSYVNDNFCDCSSCEDEDTHTCDSCSGGCPSACGQYESCR